MYGTVIGDVLCSLWFSQTQSGESFRLQWNKFKLKAECIALQCRL